MGEQRGSNPGNLWRRVVALLTFLLGSLWYYFWEFIRTLIYEHLAHILSPFINLVTLDRLLHWVPPLILAAIGIWLFWTTGRRPAHFEDERYRKVALKPWQTLSGSQKIAVTLTIFVLMGIAVDIVVIESRDGRNLTDKEIGLMAARLQQHRPPPNTHIRILCVFDSPQSCEYARKWARLFDQAQWLRTSITPTQENIDGIRIYVRDPTVDGYLDLISAFGIINIKPDVAVVPYAGNEIQILIGSAS